MTQLTKKRTNGKGNGGFFPSLRNDFFLNRFLSPDLLNFNDNKGCDSPSANITETNKDFKLDLSVPGMKREDFKIDVDHGILTISSEKEEKINENDKHYHRHEFSYSSFSRSFSLPDNVDDNNINAKYDNGMLQITVPKNEMTVSKPKKQIKVG